MDINKLLLPWFWMIVMIPCSGQGQFADDFSDGNFSSDPPWTGDAALFRVNDGLQLQLYDAAAGQAGLYSPVSIQPDMEWRCWVRQSFSPSGNNHGRVYLTAAFGDTLTPPDGYFLQFGESGSDDAIRLMRQDNGDTTTLIKGEPGAIAASFQCRVRVLCREGQWELMADYGNTGYYQPQGSCYSLLPAGESFLGVYCTYTTSNSKKFYFDDFYAGAPQYDTIAPEVLAVRLSGPAGLQVSFSEPVDEADATLSDNYFVDGGMGHPSACIPDAGDPSRVNLLFAHDLPYGILLHLHVGSISDLSGNMMEGDTLEFAWYEPARYDIVINELMADPSPPVLLPEFEYIELFNTSNLPLDLTGWTLTVGTAEKDLTGARLAPQGYLIIGKQEAESQFAAFGPFFGLESFSLTNAGQYILLADSNGMMISGLYYSSTWYGNDEKADGGWSLEQVNPYDPCLQSANWAASQDVRGGTPGSINSIYDDFPVETEIVHACAIDPQRIRVTFNQSLAASAVPGPEGFSIDHGAGPVEAVLPEDAFFMSFILYPAHALSAGIIYSLGCHSTIYNCVGDSVVLMQAMPVSLPEEPVNNDLVINEVLFNPFPGGSDYVEIYNRSPKAISLSGLTLASVSDKAPAPPDTGFCKLDGPCRVLLPGDYALLCDDFNGVDNFYFCRDTKNHIEPEGFPSYSNEKGMVVLFSERMEVIDAFSYHEDMHYPLLNLVEGVSLERLHHDRPSSDRTNWHSASQLSGFGTPGYRNSQFTESGSTGGEVVVEPPVFSPGCNGYRDHADIRYRFSEAGYLASIMLFDASGQMVRHLVNNELLGTEGSYSWDGITDDRMQAPAGMYVVMVELTDIRGKILRYKRTVAVAP